MKRFALLTTIAMLSIAAPGFVFAGHTGGCTTSADAVAVGPVYIHPALYVYQESNDMPGLQRGGENSEVGSLILGPDVFPQCLHPDTIIL